MNKRQIRRCESRGANSGFVILIIKTAQPPDNALNTGFFDSRDFSLLKCDCIKDDVFIDDGISGTTFERAEFQRMIGDIEGNKVGTIICKDLSRLGRNNALVAYYTEIFFPENQVRFIAVNDCIDSAKGDNEIMGFRSVINEYYAKDITANKGRSQQNP